MTSKKCSCTKCEIFITNLVRGGNSCFQAKAFSNTGTTSIIINIRSAIAPTTNNIGLNIAHFTLLLNCICFSSDICFRRKTLCVKIMPEVFKLESIVDIITAIIPDIASPLIPVGNNVLITCGIICFALISGNKITADNDKQIII